MEDIYVDVLRRETRWRYFFVEGETSNGAGVFAIMLSKRWKSARARRFSKFFVLNLHVQKVLLWYVSHFRRKAVPWMRALPPATGCQPVLNCAAGLPTESVINGTTIDGMETYGGRTAVGKLSSSLPASLLLSKLPRTLRPIPAVIYIISGWQRLCPSTGDGWAQLIATAAPGD